MFFSTLDTPHLCLIRKPEADSYKVICGTSVDRATALVLFLIGLSFVFTGLYLLLSGIGTIPCMCFGSGLLIAGAGFIVQSNFNFFKAFNNKIIPAAQENS
jgi:hypothetical protein